MVSDNKQPVALFISVNFERTMSPVTPWATKPWTTKEKNLNNA